jgi:pilus assembly protein Flp/PilA
MTALFIKAITFSNSVKNSITNHIESIKSQESGVTAVEYALLIGLIAVALIVTVTVFGRAIADLFVTVQCQVTGKTFNARVGTVAAYCGA